MIVAVSTDMRAEGTATGGRASAMARLAGDAGAPAVHVGGGLLMGALGGFVAEVLRGGLDVTSMTLPLPAQALAPRKRLPYLSAREPDERAAALALAGEGMAAGAALGVRFAFLDFGTVALPVMPGEVARLFARREHGAGESGAARIELALAARRAAAARLLDGCRWSLERLARQAEARGMTLLLPAAGMPWLVPSPREAMELLEAFRGAPLGLAWDPGRLSALRALGLALSDARAQALAAAAAAAIENDAVGLEAGYLPGLGERDPALPAAPKLPGGAPVVITGGADVTVEEVAAAVAAVTSRYA